MEWSESEVAWFEVCRGKRCCICEERIPPPHERCSAYCLTCVPDGAGIPHDVSIHIDHHAEGYSAQVVYEELPRFVLWMIRLGREQVRAVLGRGRVPQHRREEAHRGMQQWGHTSMHTHLAEAEYQRLRDAARRDPRTAYEKEKEFREREGK